MYNYIYLVLCFFTFNLVCSADDFITPLPSPTHNPPVLHADDPRVCPKGHRRELEHRRAIVSMSFEEVKEKFYDYRHDVSKISSILDQTDKFILERFLNVDNTDQINSAEIKKEPNSSYSITQTSESTKKVAFLNLNAFLLNQNPQ